MPNSDCGVRNGEEGIRRPHFRFQLLHSERGGAARLAALHTPRGTVQTPTFMPVGTLGTVKGVDIGRVRETGAQIVLANTYHLALRPGEETVDSLGGLHEFMGWSGPILTDSGGFQVFSLADRAKITEQGVTFRSHLDGSPIELTPERSMAIQARLGADIIMAFDHVVALPNSPEIIEEATWRSVRWAERCRRAQQTAQDEASTPRHQMLMAIVQGGLDLELRRRCAQELVKQDFAGYAVGGLSVGEEPAQMYKTLDATVPELPTDRPRYLMGVGRPEDLIEGIARGIDMFDCVMPTRNGRNSLAFTDRGTVRLRNAQHRQDRAPLEPDCPCPACQHSRGYLRHLFQSNEMLGPILTSIHNLTYYQRLMAEARTAIEEDRFDAFRQEKHRRWSKA